eukprot:1240902-Pyramimonas_sp.AAC.1
MDENNLGWQGTYPPDSLQLACGQGDYTRTELSTQACLYTLSVAYHACHPQYTDTCDIARLTSRAATRAN